LILLNELPHLPDEYGAIDLALDITAIYSQWTVSTSADLDRSVWVNTCVPSSGTRIGHYLWYVSKQL
jgi:hypothetical protein